MELVRCISERKSMPEQITVGKKYWIDYSTAWKDHDGDEYAQVYLDEAKEHRVGELMTSHFETVYRYLNYGESLTHYVNSRLCLNWFSSKGFPKNTFELIHLKIFQIYFKSKVGQCHLIDSKIDLKPLQLKVESIW